MIFRGFICSMAKNGNPKTPKINRKLSKSEKRHYKHTSVTRKLLKYNQLGT